MISLLDVFLSSHINEFKKDRLEISRRICKIPFLNCQPLERRGAGPQKIKEASLKAARECDIYLGIFGLYYSELTIDEFHESQTKFKPCLTYVLKKYSTENRDDRLIEFIDSDLSTKVKYHEFRNRKKLYDQIENDLQNLLYETLKMGLQKIDDSKTIAQKIDKEKMRKIEQTPLIPSYTKSMNLVTDSEKLLIQGNYLEAIISTIISLENILKSKIIRFDVSIDENINNVGLGKLAKDADFLGLINKIEYKYIMNIVEIRNKVYHKGFIPSYEEIKTSIDISNDIISKMSNIDLSYNTLFFDGFENDIIGSVPSKWDIEQNNGIIKIMNMDCGARNSLKYLNITSPYESIDTANREIIPCKKLEIIYYIRQEIYGKNGVGAGLHYYYGNIEAIWMAISHNELRYFYNKKHYTIKNIEIGKWYKIKIIIDCTKNTFQCYIDDVLKIEKGYFRNRVPIINKIATTGWNKQNTWSTSIDEITIKKIE